MRGKVKNHYKNTFSNPYYQCFIDDEFEIDKIDGQYAHIRLGQKTGIIDLDKIEILPDKSDHFKNLYNKLESP